MKLTFIGAAHEVTGSCTLLEVNGQSILIDCGMEQGRDRFVNQKLPVDASMIRCVLLTHAHIDHSGNLPLLYKMGFRGEIYATEATSELCNIMLQDSARIQESEAEWKSRKAKRAGEAAYEPVYDIEDALGAISLFRPCIYNEIVSILPGLEIRFSDIGHLLGSAAIETWLQEDDQKRKLVFSGDIGNLDQPIINDPGIIRDADFVMIESTYGDRLHQARVDPIPRLTAIIQKTLDRGGNLVIPSFAVGRTQELLYFIRQIKQDRLVHGHENFAVYVDSPLANEATNIFQKCDASIFDAETRELIGQGINPITFAGLHLATSQDQSRLINDLKEPKIIIAASGMCEAGRIRHHLKHNLWRSESTILFVGFQAVGTLGRSLLEGAKTARIFGETIGVKAEIEQLQGVSGHADKQGLINWLCGFDAKPRTVFINHGEAEVADNFSDCLEKQYGYHTFVPYSGAEYDLLLDTPVRITNGVPFIREETPQRTRSRTAFDRLIAAARQLLHTAESCEGIANAELEKFTDQILNLIQKWKR